MSTIFFYTTEKHPHKTIWWVCYIILYILFNNLFLIDFSGKLERENHGHRKNERKKVSD